MHTIRTPNTIGARVVLLVVGAGGISSRWQCSYCEGARALVYSQSDVNATIKITANQYAVYSCSCCERCFDHLCAFFFTLILLVKKNK